MQQYLDLMRDVVDNGITRGDRTGTGTRSVFGRQLRFDLSQGFPLVTTKTVHLKSIIVELLWFLQAEPMSTGCRNVVAVFGMNGQRKMAILALCTENSGAVGPVLTAQQ